MLPARSTCRAADEPHRIRISSDSAPSGTDVVFATATALAGKSRRKYQTATTKATTITGSARRPANLTPEASLGRTVIGGATRGGADATANSRFGAAVSADSNPNSSSWPGSESASGAWPLLADRPFSRNCGTYWPDGTTMRTWWPAPRSEEHTSELQSLRHLVCRL